MKRSITILIFYTSFLILQISCKKEFLEPKPLSFFAPENVYVNKAGFESGLVTVRKDLKSDFYGYENPIHRSRVGDIAVAYTDMHQETPSSAPTNSYFNNIYGYIKNTNIIISRIDDIKWESQEIRNAILAQAYFFRSYWFYRLVHDWGDVPFIGKELKSAKIDFVTHSRWAILKKIQTDLEFASQWLPEKDKLGYPTKYAALHLLAKVYLANLEFDKAIAATTSIINGPFALMKDRFGSYASDKKRNVIWDLHRQENKALTQNTEAILICVDRASATGANSFSWTMRCLSFGWYHPYNKDSEGKQGGMDRFPDGTNTPMYDTLGRGDSFGTSVWFGYTMWEHGGYNWKNTPDLRRADINWVDRHEILYNRPTSKDYGKPVNPKYFSNPADSMWICFAVPHYKIYMPHEKSYTGVPYGGNGHWYVFRLAETYLIRAEAYLWKGQLSSAANDINAVRERAKALPINPGDVTINFIFDERARELYVEEQRHTEIVRASYIMAKLNLNGYSLNTFSTKNWYYDRTYALNNWFQLGKLSGFIFSMSPFHILYPIPESVITANTMGVINQNIGYVGAEKNVTPIETIED